MQAVPRSPIDVESKRIFNILKPICVPLLQNARLTPTSTPVVSNLLQSLLGILRDEGDQLLPDGLIKYIFFPLSGIIRQNLPSTIPDHILERIFDALSILIKSWWWTMDKSTWERLVILCSLALPVGSGSETKVRDEETQAAAVRCLWELVRMHEPDKRDVGFTTKVAEKQIRIFSATNMPLLGQTLTALLSVASSREQKLQILSLKTVHSLVENFFGEEYAPTVMPGVVSALSRLIPRRQGSTHQRGEIVKWSLTVMQITITLGIGDRICIQEGVIRVYNSLEDFSSSPRESILSENPPVTGQGEAVKRTPSWLNATAAQLHNALNTLIPPIIEHPTPIALQGLIEFCETVLIATTLTLPQSQGLLLVPLLTLSLHPLPDISERSQEALFRVLAESLTSPSLLQTFVKLGEDSLSALPRLLASGQGDRLLRCLKILTAIAKLSNNGMSPISRNISHILGPSGGIEKWGWGILDGLSLSIPNVYFAPPNIDALLIQSNATGEEMPVFPDVSMEHAESVEIQKSLSTFFRTWGRVAGDEGLFTVEWFVGFASKGTGSPQVSALWCAARLLEGISDNVLNPNGDAESATQKSKLVRPASSRLRQYARWMVKLVASFWERDLEEESDDPTFSRDRPSENLGPDSDNQLVEFIKGMQPLEKLLDMGRNAKATNTGALRETQQNLYRAQALQLLALGASILETRFPPLLMQALYPILYSLVSANSFLSATAQCALLHVARSCGYASASNLLLSNFDYALGSVSRYLTRQRLDMHAPRVFVILVKLVGKGVIDRAADVVEECFDRLDDYHGYRVIVEGLVDVLLEVVRAVDRDDTRLDKQAERRARLPRDERREKMQADMTDFIQWYKIHNQPRSEEVNEDFGPYPRRAWGQEEDVAEDKNGNGQAAEDGPPKLSPTQKLVQQVLDKSIYFLTHPSAVIRARVLSVLASSISTLSSVESSLLPTIHTAWPFILNRFKTTTEEPFVVVEAAELIRALVENVGNFMDSKVWEDVWPVFRNLVERLEAGDKHSALARRRGGMPSIGTENAYTTSHRLYRAILSTISLSIAELTLSDKVAWEVLLVCRRFMSEEVHEELQSLAREVYLEMSRKNADAVWLALGGAGSSGPAFLILENGRKNVEMVFDAMD
ncbi:hypothetical protein M408DRAFT_29694 [Serendipita vermifera MAFF 305830]|uniref:Uncharacterized protein n=1 Tax=Serendipita vermifera MAFF 305830 TaxID=933852 RepID=A0A0C3AMJ7_SERVB|nr:hypothetical protein M408DRAFT_29694 [Serendipita vermifera MAFF 305830]